MRYHLIITLALASLIGCASKKQIVNQSPAQIPDYTEVKNEVIKEPVQDIVEPAVVSHPAIMETVNFEFDSYDLSETAKFILQGIVYLACDMPSFQVRITGHACPIGSNEYNYTLGLKRAVSVSEYLKSYGIPAKSITVESEGERYPISSDKNEYWKNRRTDIEVISWPQSNQEEYWIEFGTTLWQ